MGETLQTLGIDWPKLIAQLINFGIVLFVLWRWAYKPVLRMLELRRDKVAESMANAEKIRQELAEARTRAQAILDEASGQGNKLIDEARVSAARIVEQETQKAVHAANEILTRARQAGEAELARLRAELRREIGRLVVTTTMQVTGKVLTPEDQMRLVEETNRQLANN